MQLELLCKCWQTATCETSPNNPSSGHCYVLLRGSQSAAKVVDVHLKCHSPSIFGHVLCTQVWELLLGKCAVNGGGGSQNQRIVILTPSISPAHFFPSPPPPFGLNLKRSRRSATPIKTVNVVSFAACLCPAAVLETAAPRPTLSFSCSLATKRPPVSKKKNPHEATQHACDYFWSSRCSAQPSASSQVTTRGLNNQTRAALVPLKIPW